MTKKGILLTLVLILIAGLSQWWQRAVSPTTSHETRAEAPVSDYFLRAFSIRDMTEAGALHYILTGDRLDYFEAQKSSVIQKPQIEFTPEEQQTPQAPWVISAELATARNESLEEVEFTQNVILQRTASHDKRAITVQSNHMLIHPKLETAVSRVRTRIDMNDTKILADSMHINMQSGEMALTNVKSDILP